MAPDLLTKRAIENVLGASRLRRLLHAGWLAPVKSSAHSVLFARRDVHLALTRLERQAVPPDRIEIARVRASEARNGHGYVKKIQQPKQSLDEIKLDFSDVTLNAYHPADDDEGSL